ncbi:glycosyl hydrolase [Cohnella sp.]|uniref:glycosyl hydrolase n=1 Tax=Cohnella sp. TaxID=1883426 RepID=UPI00356566BB
MKLKLLLTMLLLYGLLGCYFERKYEALTSSSSPRPLEGKRSGYTGDPPVNPDASIQARQLLAYLNELSGSYSGMLTGQHNWLGASSANIRDLVLPISEGKYPAISSFELGAIGGQDDAIVHNHRTEAIRAARAYWRAGGIPSFSWHQQFPLTANTWNNVWNDSNKDGFKTQEEFDRVVTPGTPEYAWMMAEYDKVAEYLKVLKKAGVPVLFRPYHEMNGYWFWWGKKENYAALWNMIYERLVEHHGLNNLLFVWNTHSPRKIDPDIDDYRLYYPGTVLPSGVIGGDGRVDVLTHNIYHGEFRQSHHDDLWLFGGGKPIGLSEVGGLPDMETMRRSQFRYAFSIAWGEKYWSEQNDEDRKRQYYSHSFAITRDEVKLPR